jgi:hypothetical protein
MNVLAKASSSLTDVPKKIKNNAVALKLKKKLNSVA